MKRVAKDYYQTKSSDQQVFGWEGSVETCSVRVSVCVWCSEVATIDSCLRSQACVAGPWLPDTLISAWIMICHSPTTHGGTITWPCDLPISACIVHCTPQLAPQSVSGKNQRNFMQVSNGGLSEIGSRLVNGQTMLCLISKRLLLLLCRQAFGWIAAVICV